MTVVCQVHTSFYRGEGGGGGGRSSRHFFGRRALKFADLSQKRQNVAISLSGMLSWMLSAFLQNKSVQKRLFLLRSAFVALYYCMFHPCKPETG